MTKRLHATSRFSFRSRETVFRKAFLTILLFGLVAAGCGSSQEPEAEIVDLKFLGADGSTKSLNDYSGELLVVNFFASNCAPCIAELPDFEEVHLANEAEITFLGVNHDITESSWRAFVAQTGITYETVFQPSQTLWKEVGAFGMPSTAFINAEGELVELFGGPLNKELLQELIDKNLLGKS